METTIELTLIPLCPMEKSIFNFLIGYTNTQAITKTTTLSFLWNSTIHFNIEFESIAWKSTPRTKTIEFTGQKKERSAEGEESVQNDLLSLMTYRSYCTGNEYYTAPLVPLIVENRILFICLCLSASRFLASSHIHFIVHQH